MLEHKCTGNVCRDLNTVQKILRAMYVSLWLQGARLCGMPLK